MVPDFKERHFREIPAFVGLDALHLKGDIRIAYLHVHLLHQRNAPDERGNFKARFSVGESFDERGSGIRRRRQRNDIFRRALGKRPGVSYVFRHGIAFIENLRMDGEFPVLIDRDFVIFDFKDGRRLRIDNRNGAFRGRAARRRRHRGRAFLYRLDQPVLDRGDGGRRTRPDNLRLRVLFRRRKLHRFVQVKFQSRFVKRDFRGGRRRGIVFVSIRTRDRHCHDKKHTEHCEPCPYFCFSHHSISFPIILIILKFP